MNERKTKLRLYVIERPFSTPPATVVMAQHPGDAIRVANKTFGHAIDCTARLIPMINRGVVYPHR